MKQYKKLSREAYNAKAEIYEKTFDGRFTEEFKSLLIKEIEAQKNDKVLDVACGTGALINKLSRLHNIEAYGIDISENMIEVARSRYHNINFQVGDSEVLQFSNELFNIITVCASFHHFPNPQQFINEASRTLVKGGRIYIAEVYLPPVIRQVCNIFIPLSSSGDVKIYSSNEIVNMYQKANLSDFRIVKRGHIQIESAQK